MHHSFNHHDVLGQFEVDDGRTSVMITGQTKTLGRDVVIVAAAPPTRNASFTGSGLPYPSFETAIGQRRVVKADASGGFTCRIAYPSAYYVLGAAYVSPRFVIGTIPAGSAKGGDIPTPSTESHVEVGPGVSFRLQTYPTVPDSHVARTSCLFYDNRSRLPMGRTQEQILRASAYTPYHVPADFWGGKPAV